MKKKFKKSPQMNYMERYMLHLRNNGYLPLNSRELVHRARELCSDIGASIRVARVASKFIEFDVSFEKEKFVSLFEKLSSIGILDNARHVVEEEIEQEQGIKDGIFYFNNERFWEAHEAWEGVWKKCNGLEKEVIQGIILVAVAFAHSQKNNDSVGLGMFGRALEKISDFTGMYHNIDVDRIRKLITHIRKTGEITRFQV